MGRAGRPLNTGFTRYLVGATISNVGRFAVEMAAGWELYDRTRSPLALGLVGLVLFVPVALLALPAGMAVDRLDRRLTLMAATAAHGLAALGLWAWSGSHGPLWAFYACMALMGTAGAFASPARSALLPALVEAGELNGAVTLATSAFQLAALAGPAAAGWAVAALRGATPLYAFDVATTALFLGVLSTVRPRPVEVPTIAPDEPGEAAGRAAGATEPPLRQLLGGLAFVMRTELLLAAITLDMFAVLLGGATALLPVFARDVFHAGPQGLGLLQVAPSLGAFLTGVALTRLPPIRRNGPVLLGMVAGFGVATVGFAVAGHLASAWAMLFLTGAFDMVSMVIRQQMVQQFTPDAMRGRVAAVHSVFVGTSNELGGFESGLTASWWGPVRAVAAGGLGTLAVVAIATWRWPGLRRMGEIQGPSTPGPTPG